MRKTLLPWLLLAACTAPTVPEPPTVAPPAVVRMATLADVLEEGPPVTEAPAVSVTVENLSPILRTRWTRFTLPKSLSDQMGSEAMLGTFRAVRGRDLGSHSTVWRAKATVGKGQKTTLPLTPATPGTPFVAHPWVADDVAELLPEVSVVKGGTIYTTSAITQLTILEADAAHQLWKIRRENKDHGLTLDWWLEVGSGDPVVDCWGRLTWSTRTDPSHSTRFGGITLHTGEPFFDDFAALKGMAAPVPGWFVAVSGPREFADGTSIDFCGQMACLPKVGAIPPDVLAATTGLKVLACAAPGTWDGVYLAARNVPVTDPPSKLETEFAKDWAAFAGRKTGDFYDDRPLGVGRHPGATGGKEDFGSVKGSYVATLGKPRWLRAMAWSAFQDVYRPGQNLLGVVPVEHPQWVTWSGYTHFHAGVSPDRISKTANLGNIGATNWDAYDDQHRSQNGLAAYYALSGDPLAEDIIVQGTIVDANRTSDGAPRATGRMVGTWTQFSLLLPSGVAKARYEEQAAKVLNRAATAGSLLVGGPVKVMAWGEPDARKQVYYPPGHPKAGQLARWWSVWEHGLAATGLKLSTEPTARAILETICTTVALNALFEFQGQWYLPDDICYLDGGARLDQAVYYPGSPQMVVTPGIGGTTGWGFQAVLIGADVLPAGLARDRCKKAVQFFTGGKGAADRMTAEWWACSPPEFEPPPPPMMEELPVFSAPQEVVNATGGGTWHWLNGVPRDNWGDGQMGVVGDELWLVCRMGSPPNGMAFFRKPWDGDPWVWPAVPKIPPKRAFGAEPFSQRNIDTHVFAQNPLTGLVTFVHGVKPGWNAGANTETFALQRTTTADGVLFTEFRSDLLFQPDPTSSWEKPAPTWGGSCESSLVIDPPNAVLFWESKVPRAPDPFGQGFRGYIGRAVCPLSELDANPVFVRDPTTYVFDPADHPNYGTTNATAVWGSAHITLRAHVSRNPRDGSYHMVFMNSKPNTGTGKVNRETGIGHCWSHDQGRTWHHNTRNPLVTLDSLGWPDLAIANRLNSPWLLWTDSEVLLGFWGNDRGEQNRLGTRLMLASADY